VASDFTRYDEHAIGQINRSIELLRYRDHDGAFLTLELVASATATAAEGEEISRRGTASDRTMAQLHERAPKDLKNYTHRRIKNDPKAITLEPGCTRDMSTIGHFGTGDLEVSNGNHGDFERAQPSSLPAIRQADAPARLCTIVIPKRLGHHTAPAA
jgi:hypothetical protein